MAAEGGIALTVRKSVNASREAVFSAWARPDRLLTWWGPRNVVCIDAQIDFKIGGEYRIGNQFTDGSVVWIKGRYEKIDRPRLLAFSWKIEGAPGNWERVTVELKEQNNGLATEIVIRHERIPSKTIRDQHEAGWEGCLAGLQSYLES